MRFTKEIQLFNIGEKIFPVDFSGFQNVTTNELDICILEDSVKEKLKKGEPLIVISKPYLVNKHCGWFFDNEYFINVKFKDSNEIYSIMNSKTNVFKSHYNYICFLAECEECAKLGY